MWGIHGDTLVGLVTFLLVIVTALSVVVSLILSGRQDRIQREIAAASKQSASDRLEIEERISKLQLIYTQRSQLIPMWQYISRLSDINPSNPNTIHVVDAANTLEFLAICCESEVVDEQLVLRTFRDKYIEIYRKIDRCGDLPGFTNPTKNGRQLLEENRAATELYLKLVAAHLSQDRPDPLTKKKDSL